MATCYIAAPYPIRDEAIRLKHLLESQGVSVTSRWLTLHEEPTDESARMDLEDVARADVLLALNPEGWSDTGTGGRHVELGYAIALGKRIVLIGERTNVFHHLADVKVIDRADDIAKQVKRASRAARSSVAELEQGMTPERAMRLIFDEFFRAHLAHAPMHSPHEGYAVILEELDELWTEVKENRGRELAAFEAAMQVAAMGLRYLVNLAPAPTTR